MKKITYIVKLYRSESFIVVELILEEIFYNSIGSNKNNKIYSISFKLIENLNTQFLAILKYLVR